MMKPIHTASCASLGSLALALAVACSGRSEPEPPPLDPHECERLEEELMPVFTDTSCAVDGDCELVPHGGCVPDEAVNRHGLERERERVDTWADRCLEDSMHGRCKNFVPRCIDARCTIQRETE
jgi:hypothetical protein